MKNRREIVKFPKLGEKTELAANSASPASISLSVDVSMWSRRVIETCLMFPVTDRQTRPSGEDWPTLGCSVHGDNFLINFFIVFAAIFVDEFVDLVSNLCFILCLLLQFSRLKRTDCITISLLIYTFRC